MTTLTFTVQVDASLNEVDYIKGQLLSRFDHGVRHGYYSRPRVLYEEWLTDKNNALEMLEKEAFYSGRMFL